MVRSLNADQLAYISDTVSHVFDLMVKMHEDDKDHGGYFCLADRDGNLLVMIAIGIMTPERAERCKKLAEEKIQRLAANPFHLSSWQSRWEECDQWGGAIRGTYNLYSFSGLPELKDEALAMVVAAQRHDLSPVTASLVERYSNNPFFRQFQESAEIVPANQ